MKKKRALEREVQTLAPLSPRHSWTAVAWSGCECQIAGFGKPAIHRRPTSASEEAHWQLKDQKQL